MPFTSDFLAAVRAHALGLPETSEGPSCVNRAFKARKKNFLFLGEKPDGACRFMVKLGPSLAEAEALAAAQVGKSGWVTVLFPSNVAPMEVERAVAWVRESFGLLAPKPLSRQLEGGSPT